MKTFKRLSVLSAALLMVSLLGCSPTPVREGTGEYVDDTVITSKVKTAILTESTLKVAQINVETFRGRVQLSGFVNSQAAVDKAEAVARSVTGVTSVKNDVTVK
jgi:osmotically-inducible protein OsmY